MEPAVEKDVAEPAVSPLGNAPAVSKHRSKESGMNVNGGKESVSLLDMNGKQSSLENGKNGLHSSKSSPSRESRHQIASDGAVISYREVSYKVVDAEKSARCGCGKNQAFKFVLKDVSGVFRPGVNAILGPTGSGKTSLLDVVAGRKTNVKGISGKVLIDGKPLPSNFKYMSGYVMQDDMVMDMLTVRENVLFSARLRLPNTIGAKVREEKVDEILRELGLKNCANTRVGNIFVRGISGGERKRANIAMELVTSPAVLFLDEPTSGLDANTAYSVMYTLKKLSQRGMTIVVSIHQPRYAIYKLFDTLTLMSHGETVYHGPAADALEFFQSLNYIYEEGNSPPDFFLDIINGSIQSTNYTEDSGTKHVFIENGTLDVVEKALPDSLVIDVPGDDVELERKESLVKAYRASKWFSRLKMDIEHAGQDEKKEPTTQTVVVSTADTYQTSFCTQLAVVSSRTWKNMARNRRALMTQLCNAVILGLIAGSIYFQVGDSPRSGIQNRAGAFFFIVMMHVFGNMAAVDIFIKERAIFVHETISGYYRVSAYFFGKLVCDVFPQRFFPIILFAFISYFLIGFRLSLVHFLFFFLNLVLTSFAGTSVALVFSATTRQHSIGTVLTALVWTIMMVFSGLLVLVDTIPVWLRWLQWFSIFRYSMNAFEVNELTGLNFCNNRTRSDFSHESLQITCDGNDFLIQQNIRHETDMDLLTNEIALICITIVFLTLTYVQLRRTTSFK